MRAAGIVAVGLCFVAGMAAGKSTPDPADAEACRNRLAASLEIMERQPLLKEEVATGLMWTRLDAEGALDAGDVQTCHRKMDVVDAILAPVANGESDG